jgi:hypothetical protein
MTGENICTIWRIASVFYQTGWSVTVLVLRRVKNIIEFTKLLQGWYHENSQEFAGSY